MNILIADDHTFIRSGLNDNLRQLFPEAVIFNAENASEALQLASQKVDFELAIVDLFMPDMDGFDFLRKLCSGNPTLPVIVISATEDTEHIRKALDLGAMSFIPKSSSTQQFNNVINIVLSGGTYIPEELIKSSPGIQDLPLHTNNTETNRKLTRRQSEILSLLREGKSNKQIARELTLSMNTIKTHVSTILKILKVENRIQASIVAKELNLH